MIAHYGWTYKSSLVSLRHTFVKFNKLSFERLKFDSIAVIMRGAIRNANIFYDDCKLKKVTVCQFD